MRYHHIGWRGFALPHPYEDSLLSNVGWLGRQPVRCRHEDASRAGGLALLDTGSIAVRLDLNRSLCPAANIRSAQQALQLKHADLAVGTLRT